MVDHTQGKSVFNSTSPDELALVNAAKYFGIKFVGRDDDNNIEIKFEDETT